MSVAEAETAVIRDATRSAGPRRAVLSKGIRYRLATLLLVAFLLVFAQVASRNGWVSDLLLPAPTDVWQAMRDQWTSPGFFGTVWSTVSAMLAGFALAIVLAAVLAIPLVLIRGLEEIVMPLIIAFESTPKIAIAPLVILWIGFGQSGKIVIVTLITFFPLLINTLQGLRVTSREEYELLQSLGANRVQLFRYVRLPRALPYIFAGLRVGAVFALLGAIVAEFVGSDNGLGALILINRSQFNVPGVWALLVDLMVMGLIVYTITWWVERRMLFWSKDVSQAAV